MKECLIHSVAVMLNIAIYEPEFGPPATSPSLIRLARHLIDRITDDKRLRRALDYHEFAAVARHQYRAFSEARKFQRLFAHHERCSLVRMAII